MFSGKTSRLLWYLKRADIAGKKVVLFKPQIDNRYSETEVVTHDNHRVPSIVISSANDILPLVGEFEVIGIDEIHFLDAQQLIRVAETLAAAGKEVITAGLDLDAEDRAFEATKELMGVSEYIEKLQAVCADCNADNATRSYRKSQSHERFEVGGKESYLPLCRSCNAQRKAVVTGKLIVIDGTDGSGKGTQVQLLAQRLQAKGYRVAVADFPRYGQASAYFCEQYLNGNYGTLEQVNSKRASLFYALDRFAASFEIRRQLADGYIVLSNRYVTASMGHQGAQIKDPVERQKFFDWLYQLEYEICGIPKPDLNIILHVPAEVGQQLVDQKAPRSYIGEKKRDLTEGNLEHLRAAEQVYLEIASKFDNFALIECMDNGTMMSREAINNAIWNTIQSRLHV